MRAEQDVKSLRLLMGSAVLAVVALLALLPLLALQVDRQSAPYETDVARAQLSQAIRRLALRTEEDAIDDVVLRHADSVVDQVWFQKNMTSPRVADVESQIVYTFDAADRVVFARDRGVPIAGRRRDEFAAAIRPLVARLRVRERGSESLRRHPRPGQTPPVVAGAAAVIVQGRVFDVQALLVASKSGTVAQRGRRAPVLLLVTDVERRTSNNAFCRRCASISGCATRRSSCARRLRGRAPSRSSASTDGRSPTSSGRRASRVSS